MILSSPYLKADQRLTYDRRAQHPTAFAIAQRYGCDCYYQTAIETYFLAIPRTSQTNRIDFESELTQLGARLIGEAYSGAKDLISERMVDLALIYFKLSAEPKGEDAS